MKIVVKNVNELPEVRRINGELKEMQDIVGGYIEAFHVSPNILCVCNEEGKIQNLPVNFNFNKDYICGNVFFVAEGEEDFESLNSQQIAFLMDVFNEEECDR